MYAQLQDPSNTRNGVKDGNSESEVHRRRIEYAITTTVDNDRYTTICILEIFLAKDDTVTVITTIHRQIFDTIKEIDNTTMIISLDQQNINHGKDIPIEEEYKNVFKD